MGSHYIKVGKVNISVDQDLMDVICPASGYIPDPSTVIMPDDYIPLPDPSEDKITFLCTDGGYKKIAFRTTVTSGQYKVDVFGLNNSVIHTENVNSGSAFYYDFVSAEGEPSSNGVSTYRIEITPANAGEHITKIDRQAITGIVGYPWAVIQVKLNIPYLTVMNYSFSGYTYLEKVTWHCEINNCTATYMAFGSCENLKYIEIPASTSLTDLTNYCNVNTSLSRAVFLGELPSLTTADFMFNGCNNLINFNWPENLPNVTSFRGVHTDNWALQSVTLPNLSDAGCNISAVFKNCYSITTADISHIKATTYATSFQGCKKLRSVKLPTSLPDNISPYYMFRDCYNLESVTFPTDMIMQSPSASCIFYNCYKLQSITFPTVAQTAELSLQQSFYNCRMLTSVTFPDDMSGVSNMYAAFYGCSVLENLTLPQNMSNVTTLYQTFYNCTKLTNLTMPTSAMDSVTTIDSCFRSCAALTSVTLPSLNSVTDMDNLFYGCTALQTITLPASLPAVTTASYWTQNCYALESISECTWPSADVNFGSYAVPTSIPSFYQPSLRTNKFGLQNAPTDNVSSIEIDWINSSYSGSSYQIDLNYGNMDATELNRIFTALPSVSGKNIRVANNPGAATCDKSIAENKGWTVYN